MVNVLKRSSTTKLHADPELVPSKVAPIVGHNVGMLAVFHHENLLLNDGKVISCRKYHVFSSSNDGQDLSCSAIPGSSLMTLMAAHSLVASLLACKRKQAERV